MKCQDICEAELFVSIEYDLHDDIAKGFCSISVHDRSAYPLRRHCHLESKRDFTFAGQGRVCSFVEKKEGRMIALLRAQP
ncbi:MAG: hypothetical protein WC483_00285 [Candidatus Paceibacterota bacterium]